MESENPFNNRNICKEIFFPRTNLFLVGLLEVLAGAGLSRPALSSLVTKTIVSFIPSLAGTTVGGRLEMHS